MDTVLRGGTQAGYLDPFMVVSAMAAVTSSVGIAITGSTSYIRRFIYKQIKPLLISMQLHISMREHFQV